jgi:excisionase family DNA binding protein
LRLVAGREGPYLTVREVAERIRVCTATVYALVKRGELEQVRVSNCMRIAESSLSRLVSGTRK